VNVDALDRDRAPATSSERLADLADVSRRLGAEEIARDAEEVASRVEEGRFFVACVGQFKRGKSTLLNALVGEPVLPTGVVPVTSAITLLRSGPRGARVRFEDGRDVAVAIEALREYVTEERNPENRKRVRAVEVSLEAPLLSRGMCLVDTPGLGSAFGGNAAITREFVPHVDAALVVIGADPPVSGDEIALVEEVARHARNLLIVLNKADRVTERERREGATFAAELLATRLHRPVGPIYEVSAQERASSGAATRDWADLVSALDRLARGSRELVHAAEARAVERLGRALLAEIAERREALVRPLADSEQRLAALERHVVAAERAMGDLGVLLAAEQARLTRTFRERQEAFLGPAQRSTRGALEESAASLDVPKRRARAAVFDAGRRVSRDVVERFRAELEPEAEKLYGATMERFVALANEFLDRFGSEGGIGAAPRALASEVGFRVRGRLQYTELLYRTSRIPMVGWLLDAARSRRGVTRAAVRDAGEYLDALVESNSSRIANDLAERSASSRARLEAEIRARLGEVSARARRALDDARHRIADGQEAVQRELSRLESLGTRIESLLAARSKGEGT
jgi:GTPase SAR1 family protein